MRGCALKTIIVANEGIAKSNMAHVRFGFFFD